MTFRAQSSGRKNSTLPHLVRLAEIFQTKPISEKHRILSLNMRFLEMSNTRRECFLANGS